VFVPGKLFQPILTNTILVQKYVSHGQKSFITLAPLASTPLAKSQNTQHNYAQQDKNPELRMTTFTIPTRSIMTLCILMLSITVVNAAFLFFETSKLWVLICIFVDRWKAEGLR
jgi:hypothetical protein